METPEASRRTMDEAMVQSSAEETRSDSRWVRKRDSNLETLRDANWVATRAAMKAGH